MQEQYIKTVREAVNAGLASGWAKGIPSQALLALIYGKQSALYHHAAIVAIRAQYKNRQHLLSWAYGNRWQGIEACYVRLPSERKRLVVGRLVSKMRTRYPWFNSKVLHAYAFKPEVFERDSNNDAHRWKSLYREIKIQIRPGKSRIIHVPSPPLKRIQRLILEEYLNPALLELPPYVMGCRPSDPARRNGYGIFYNAAAHIGQQFLVQFDLRDFYPSIRMADVVATLKRQRIGDPAGHDAEPSSAACPHDLAVLIARLVTRRGRLTQGSPTSPAIANLVFQQIDETLMQQFGNELKYTRYVDDLTFSISGANAKKLGIRDAASLRRLVEPKLAEALARTSFSINDRKTSQSSLESGHRVTGLTVGRKTIGIPKPIRQRLRGLIHSLNERGLVRTALTGYLSTSKQSFPSMAGDNHFIRPFRSLFTRFLREKCPGLQISVAQQTESENPESPIGLQPVDQGKIHTLAEVLLELVWKRKLAVRALDGQISFYATEESAAIAQLRADSNSNFFMLDALEAKATVKLYAELRGWHAFLNSMTVEYLNHNVTALQLTLGEAIERSTIDGVGKSAPDSTHATRGDGREASERLQEVVNQVRKPAHTVYELIAQLHVSNEKWSLIGNSHFYEAVTSRSQFQENWLPTALLLWLNIPAQVSEGEQARWQAVQTLLTVTRDRLNRQRLPFYELEAQLLQPLPGCTSFDDVKPLQWEQVQLLLLGRMEQALIRMLNKANNEELVPVACDDDASSALREKQKLGLLVDRLQELHNKAIWPENGNPVFTDIAKHEFIRLHAKFCMPIEDSTPFESWTHLLEFAMDLINVTTDPNCLTNPHAGTSKEKWRHQALFAAADVPHQSYEVLYKLRCIKGHRSDPQREFEDFCDCYQYCAKVLGRRFKKPNVQSDLEPFFGLGPLEATILKMHFLNRFVDLLERLKAKRINESHSLRSV